MGPEAWSHPNEPLIEANVIFTFAKLAPISTASDGRILVWTVNSEPIRQVSGDALQNR